MQGRRRAGSCSEARQCISCRGCRSSSARGGKKARIAALKVALAGLLEIEAAKAAARERTSGGGGELVGKAGSGINRRRGTQAEERLEDEEINITLLLTQLASIRTAEGADARGLVHAMHAAVDAATRAAATRAATAHGSLASYIETLASTTDGTTTNWKSCLDNTKAKNSPSNVGTALSKSGDAAAKAILDAACPEGMLGKDLNLDNTLRDLAQLGTSIANTSLRTNRNARQGLQLRRRLPTPDSCHHIGQTRRHHHGRRRQQRNHIRHILDNQQDYERKQRKNDIQQKRTTRRTRIRPGKTESHTAVNKRTRQRRK
ncbi:hypothetical protein ERJ75_000654900 [Trypanosoma vivax]|nr:hypothetical protein ERJ75_000654900 [Trypanosoma vivax]